MDGYAPILMLLYSCSIQLHWKKALSSLWRCKASSSFFLRSIYVVGSRCAHCTVLTVVYLLSRMPTPFLSGTCPYECLYGQVPNYSPPRVFGSACFVLLPKRNWTKLGAHCVLRVFLGYIIKHKGYQCYDPVTKNLMCRGMLLFLSVFPISFFLPKHL